MEEEILALAEARRAEAEVIGIDENRTVVEFKANAFHSQDNRLTRGYGLRLVREGRVGFSSTTNPDVLPELVEAALDNAALGRLCRFDFPGPGAKPAVKTFDNRVIMLPAQKMIDWGRELIAAIRSRVPAMTLDVTFTRSYRETVLINSAGLDTRFSCAEFDLSVTGLLVQDGLVWISEYENLSAGQAPALGLLADRIEKRAKAARSRARLPAGIYPVILMPSAVTNLLLPIKVGVSGKQLEKGASPLIGKVGQQVLDEEMTITDNGLRDFGLASAPLDAEGVPRRRTVLFDHGVFRGFLFDLATAGACHTETTGSAGRSYHAQPQPGTSNLELATGSARLEPTLKDTRSGLLVYDCLGGGQSNLLAGDVALNLSSAYRIENGEITGRVKDAMIAGNVFEMFNNVEAVGDSERDLGNYFVPFVMFSGLKVATKD